MATAKSKLAALPKVKVMLLNDKAMIPAKQTSGSVGYDLYVTESIRVYPTTTTDIAYKVGTGLAFEIPEGYHAKIFLRSSTGANRKLRLANGTGIIDSDYRGEVMLLIENVGFQYEHLDEGERIAQMILEKNVEFTLEITEAVAETKRGEGGIGSTGTN